MTSKRIGTAHINRVALSGADEVRYTATQISCTTTTGGVLEDGLDSAVKDIVQP
jgi:hypothetical protein